MKLGYFANFPSFFFVIAVKCVVIAVDLSGLTLQQSGTVPFIL